MTVLQIFITFLLLFLGLVILIKRPNETLYRTLLNVIFGTFGILICNFILDAVGVSVSVALNFFTLFIIGALGFPGFIMIYIMAFIFSL